MKPVIAIISPSIRKGRNSHRVALYFLNLIKELNIADAEIIDLLKYNFPLFNERLKYLDSPSAGMSEFAGKIKSADGVIIITPEYNGGYPASLKNAIDLLVDEWRRKPVAFVTVSDGNFAGTQVITSLQFTFWKLGALTVPSSMRLPDIPETFNENGVPANKPVIDKRARKFLDELMWMTEAVHRMKSGD
jgi:NAD(P)H-dependent FMN reductase